jgi:hypothetical protein
MHGKPESSTLRVAPPPAEMLGRGPRSAAVCGGKAAFAPECQRPSAHQPAEPHTEWHSIDRRLCRPFRAHLNSIPTVSRGALPLAITFHAFSVKMVREDAPATVRVTDRRLMSPLLYHQQDSADGRTGMSRRGARKKLLDLSERKRRMCWKRHSRGDLWQRNRGFPGSQSF